MASQIYYDSIGGFDYINLERQLFWYESTSGPIGIDFGDICKIEKDIKDNIQEELDLNLDRQLAMLGL
jgi:hypothetical protein